MKKNLLLLGLIPMLLLTACSNDDPTTSTQSNSEHSTSVVTSESKDDNSTTGEVPQTKLISVIFFESAVNCQPDKAFFKCKAHLGGKIEKPEGHPESTDTAFNVFKGWSNKQIVMDENDYWDFENDVIPIDYDEQSFRIYGQWDFVE